MINDVLHALKVTFSFPLAGAALAVLGWIVSAAYAQRRIKVAHMLASELQHEFFVRERLYRSFVDVIFPFLESLVFLRRCLVHACNNLKAQMACNTVFESLQSNREVNVTWEQELRKVEEAYIRFSSTLYTFNHWLHVSSNHMPKANEFKPSLEDCQNIFMSGSADHCLWVDLAGKYIALQMAAADGTKSSKFTTAANNYAVVAALLIIRIDEIRCAMLQVTAGVLSDFYSKSTVESPSDKQHLLPHPRAHG